MTSRVSEMAAPSEMYDTALLGILQHVGEIKPFLEVVFSFLMRRTDFYRIMQSREDRMGFPPGVSKQLVMQAFIKYEQIAQKLMGREYEEKMRTGEVAPRAVESVEVSTDETPKESVEKTAEKRTDDSKRSEQSTSKPSDTTTTDTKIKSHPYESGLPTITAQKADCYNGALTDNYSWSQTFNDVDIRVPVPKEVKRAKDLIVEIGRDRIKVAVKPGVIQEEGKILVEGKLTLEIRKEESMWSLESGVCLQMTLEKQVEKMWLALLEGEKEIKQDEIDPTRHLHEMDEDSQAGWRQAMFDFQQKQAGQPTSKEMEAHQILEKAWNVEGSPFKGTPFDPSKLNIST
ncbi:nudC domain-containing protein 3-like [Ptychodera flava]|uniref:nudC domain-containing protein 3-like n=1 Tax=Ptychodera flava TaxID=63121 RepID=UPI003969D470